MSEKTHFIVCFFISIAFFSHAQVRYNPDSLIGIVAQKKGLERVEVFRQISIGYVGADKEKSLFYAAAALQAAEETGNDTFIVRCLINMAAMHQNVGDVLSSHPFLDRALQITTQNGNLKQRAEALEYKATAFSAKHQTDKALPPAKEALLLTTRLKDSVGMLNALETIAAAHKDLNQFQEAMAIYRQELAILTYLPNRKFELGRAEVNLGEVYMRLNQPDQAIDMYQKGKADFEQMGYPVGALIAELNLADCYLSGGQPEKARRAFQHIIEVNKDIGELELEAQALTGLGVVAMRNRQNDEALAYFKQAESIGKSASLMYALKEIYGFMNQYYCAQGDWQTASQYKDLSQIYADSIVTAETLERLSDLQVQYETAEKDLKIAQQDRNLIRKNAINYGLGGSLLAFLILGYLYYNRFRLRKKAELDAAIIREQQLGLHAVIDAQEEERKRIAKDLHDGIAQELVALKLGFEALNRRLAKNMPAESPYLGELTEQINHSCHEVRTIAHTMMPPALEKQGLVQALNSLLNHTLLPAGVALSFTHQALPDALPDRIALGFYRIAQELLNNAVKHAKADQIKVDLRVEDNRLVMTFSDNGVGYDFEYARSQPSMGLHNILSRVGRLNGQFKTEIAQPRGVVSIVSAPLS